MVSKELTENRTGDDFLTPDRVRTIYERCYRDESVNFHMAKVEGWICRHTLSITQLAQHREEIIRLLLCLHPGFRVDEKGGGSVAAATVRGDGVLWTGEPSDVEKLIALGIAAGLVSFLVPREGWGRLPGGLPYVRVEITRLGVSLN